RNDFVRDPCGRQRGLGFLNGHVLDKFGIVRLLPTPSFRMNPWTLSNLNGRKPLPASGPFWASAASMSETGLGRPNAAPAHAAVNRALRRVRFSIAISLLC